MNNLEFWLAIITVAGTVVAVVWILVRSTATATKAMGETIDAKVGAFEKSLTAKMGAFEEVLTAKMEALEEVLTAKVAHIENVVAAGTAEHREWRERLDARDAVMQTELDKTNKRLDDLLMHLLSRKD